MTAVSMTLHGRRILVVEDDYLVAADLAESLENAGASVIGPAGSVEEALRLVQEENRQLDGAVLDINLRDARVYPVAELLEAQHVPYIFTTGYDSSAVSKDYAHASRIEKPVDTVQLIRWIEDKIGNSNDDQ